MRKGLCKVGYLIITLGERLNFSLYLRVVHDLAQARNAPHHGALHIKSCDNSGEGSEACD